MAAPFDTNLIIRYLSRDHVDHSHRAYQFFRRLRDGTEQAELTEGVLVEAVQVLSSQALYNLPRDTIHYRLQAIIRLRGTRLPPRRRYLRALYLYATTNLDFVDAILVAMAEHSSTNVIISFDTGIGRVPGIIRKEPAADGSIS